MHLIPAIDLRDGYCVRLLHGNFEAETRYPTDPEALLIKYRNLGADWLHIVDLDGARGGTLDNRAIILQLAAQKALKWLAVRPLLKQNKCRRGSSILARTASPWLSMCASMITAYLGS